MIFVCQSPDSQQDTRAKASVCNLIFCLFCGNAIRFAISRKHPQLRRVTHGKKQGPNTQNFPCHILQLRGYHYFPAHLYHACLMAFRNEYLIAPPGKYFFPVPSLQNLSVLFCLDNLMPNDQAIKNVTLASSSVTLEPPLMVKGYGPTFTLLRSNLVTFQILNYKVTAILNIARQAHHFYYSGKHIYYKPVYRL